MGLDTAETLEILRRLTDLSPLVSRTLLWCGKKPCTGKPEEHTITVTFYDSDESDIEPGNVVVFYCEEPLVLILPEEVYETRFRAERKLSKKERWFTRGWNGAVDAVLDVIGEDISPAMRQQVAELRED